MRGNRLRPRATTAHSAPAGALPWYINAAKLVYAGLPRDAPITNALVQDVARLQQPAWNAQHKGLPTDMQSYIPEGAGNYLDASKFLPSGSGDNPLQTAGSLVAPAVSSSILGLFGLDPYGAPLKSPTEGYQAKPGSSNYGYRQPPYDSGGIISGNGQSTGRALLQGAEQFLGGILGPGQRVADAVENKGRAVYSASTPLLQALSGGAVGHEYPNTYEGPEPMGPLGGLLGRAVDRVADPFAPTRYGATTTKSNVSTWTPPPRTAAPAAAPSGAARGNFSSAPTSYELSNPGQNHFLVLDSGPVHAAGINSGEHAEASERDAETSVRRALNRALEIE